jgi:hypothetical protein
MERTRVKKDKRITKGKARERKTPIEVMGGAEQEEDR